MCLHQFTSMVCRFWFLHFSYYFHQYWFQLIMCLWAQHSRKMCSQSPSLLSHQEAAVTGRLCVLFFWPYRGACGVRWVRARSKSNDLTVFITVAYLSTEKIIWTTSQVISLKKVRYMLLGLTPDFEKRGQRCPWNYKWKKLFQTFITVWQ